MDDVAKALSDRAALEEVMNRYAAAIDRRDWPFRPPGKPEMPEKSPAWTAGPDRQYIRNTP
jgi:hypothetical protein